MVVIVLVNFFKWYKEFDSCLISFISFCELFPAFNWAKVIGNLLSIWSGVNIFSPIPLCFLFCSADYSLSNSDISVVSSGSSDSCFSLSDFF